MFCSECGVKASGKFCHQCGSRLHSAETALTLPEQDVPVDAGDWEQEARYEAIIQIEAVRAVIAGHAASAPHGLSGEKLLALYDKVMSSPVSLESLVEVVQPLYESWGIRTGKERTEVIDAPIGRTIARALCSLAKHAQTFQRAEQRAAGCVLTAELPSSVCALKGRLTISLTKRDRRTEVSASTYIPGQMFDWGKSQRCLETFFADLRSDMGLPAGEIRRHVA